ncbi:MAG: aminoglycoside phosphotransferase family protein [Thermomicrobiales bacterium]
MNTPPSPADLDPNDLAALVSRRWEFPDLALTYQAVGFGSHHWRADAADGSGQRWFLTVDERGGIAGSAEMLARALQTASALRDLGGVAETVAPVPDRAGAMLATLQDGRWTVAVYPWLEVEPSRFGAFASETDRADVQRLIARIHAATPMIPPDLPRREDFRIPHRADLDAALVRLEVEWTCGPFAEPARMLLREYRAAVIGCLAVYNRLMAAVHADPAPWVITHGEPHAGNIIRRRDGDGWAIVDWDTCALAPRERDLWQLLPSQADPAAGLVAYQDMAGGVPISEDALALYRLAWDLSEVAVYTVWFANPHDDTDDMRVGFGGLRESLAKLANSVSA